MDFDDITLGEIRKIRQLLNTDVVETAYKVGEKYFIRTITNYFTGRIIRIVGNTLILVDVAWIADTGDYSKSLVSGNFSEVEPYPDGEVLIQIPAIVDAMVWPHTLPRMESV